MGIISEEAASGRTAEKQIISGRFPQGDCLIEECLRKIIKGKLLIEMFIFSFHMGREAQPMSSKLEPKPGAKLFQLSSGQARLGTFMTFS
jgi:hypothetical protein